MVRYSHCQKKAIAHEKLKLTPSTILFISSIAFNYTFSLCTFAISFHIQMHFGNLGNLANLRNLRTDESESGTMIARETRLFEVN